MIAKICVDIGMTAALLLLMPYELVGQAAHEWIEIGIFILFIIHHILGRMFIYEKIGILSGTNRTTPIPKKRLSITSVIFMRNSKYTLKSLITSKVYAMSDISLMCRIQMNKIVLPSRKICDGFLFMKEILSETCGTIWRNSKKVYRGEFNLPRRLSYSQSHSNYELSAVSRDAQTGAEWDVV